MLYVNYLKPVLVAEAENKHFIFLISSDFSGSQQIKNKLPFHLSSSYKAIISPVENPVTCVQFGGVEDMSLA